MAEWEKDPEVPAWQRDPEKKREHTTAETVADVGDQGLRGFNKGLVGVATAPYEAMRYVLDKGISIPGIGSASPGIKLPAAEDMPLYRPFLKQPEPETDAGRYARAAGEVVGASVPVTGGLLSAGQRMAAMAPTTTGRAIAQTIAQPYATAPGAAVVTDIVSGIGAGVGQQAAHDMGFGPAGEVVGATLGAMTPLGVKSLWDVPAATVREARARANPHAKIAEKLGDTSVDDLAAGIAVGDTRMNQPLAQRVFDSMGQEMVRANGNWEEAYPALVRRLMTEGQVTEATAREQIRRVVSAHADSDLLLGEYPAVMASNEATRNRQPTNILDSLDSARNMPNKDAAARVRQDMDPGRIEDSNVHWMLDTLGNGGGNASTTVRNAISDRLQALRDTAMQRIRSWSPNEQLTQDADAAIEGMRQAGNQAYRAVYDAPGGTAVNYNLLHNMLGRIVDRQLSRAGRYNADQAQALRDAVERLFVTRPAGQLSREAMPGLEDDLAAARAAVREARRQRQPKDVQDNLAREAERIAEELRLTRRDASPPTQQFLLPTLEQLQNSRTAIRAQLDGYRADPSKRHLLPIVEPLYRDITRIMERASPQWRVANRQWADLRMDVVARELGENISERAGPQFRQQMRQFNQLAPEAQDFVRIEIAQKLLDKVHNLGDGDNIAKIFKTPHMKELVRTMFGDEAAVDMRRLVRDLNVTTKSKNMMGGSPTQPRLSRQKELNSDIELLSSAEIPTTLGEFLNKVKQYTVGRVIDRRNAQMANTLTTPVRQTAQVAEQIERMRQAQAAAARFARPYSTTREAFGAALRRGLTAVPGAAASTYGDQKKP